ncbi:MAG: aldo/keto reductase [Microbacteriaceae bacterium]|nr:aldo/keto reductase [Burkholderiaceae bacterium]
MRYHTLGQTGLFVSELALGTMTFGGTGPYAAMGNIQQAEAEAVIQQALAAGINLIDTADTYSGGDAERIVGQALKNLGVPRDEVLIATKVFGEVTGTGPNQRGNSRAHILDGVTASLQRLQLEHIDLYQLHGFDPATPLLETLRALDDLVRQGLVRYIGVSNWAAWQIAQAQGIARQHGLTPFVSAQAFYSLAGRDVEREILPMAASEGLGLLAWSPLAGGLLGGRVNRHNASAEGTRRAAFQFPPADLPRAYDTIDVLAQIASRQQASIAQVALAWLLHQPRVSSVILGARNAAQLGDNLGAAAIKLGADELQQLDAASGLPPEYPGWMLAMWSQSRAQQLADSKR